MIKFLKKLRKIVANYDADINGIGAKLNEVNSLIRDRTEVHADIHRKSPAQVVMIGRYRGRDFVNIYDIGQGEFESLLNHLREIDRYAKPGRMDSPWPAVTAVIERELRP